MAAWVDIAPEQIVITPPNDVHPRLEIRTLLFDHKMKWQRSLFLQAFQRLLARPASSAASFYQIAGIHGAPYVPYDRVGLEENKESNWGGYCWHGSQLFPTWHRPYVMLVEQELRNCAFELITGWRSQLDDMQGQDGYEEARKKLESFAKAADELRFPYLDWGSLDALQYGLPDELCGLAELTVETPFDSPSKPPVVIGNPLKSFVLPVDLGDVHTDSPAFNPMNKPKYKPPPDGYPYTPKGYATVRYPDAEYESQAYDLLHTSLQNTAKIFRPGLSYMFGLDNWKEFSNHTTGPRVPVNGDGALDGNERNTKKRKTDAQKSGSPAVRRIGVSLEGIHDQVHNTLGGGGGHMQYPEVAAFDPIFYLHHANVDRLLALWQAVYDDPNNPKTWIEPTKESADGTWSFPAVTVTDEKTPLTPFRWRKQRETVVDGKVVIDQTDLDAFWTAQMVRSLDPDATRGIKGTGYTYPELIEWQGLTRGEKLTKINQMYGASVEYTGYRLHAEFSGVVKRQLNGPFEIRVFVGYGSDYKVNKNTPTKGNSHFAGSLSIFAGSRSPSNRCANCNDPARQLLSGSVDLTAALLKVGLGSELGWIPSSLAEDEVPGQAPWTYPPKLSQPQMPWSQIQAVVLANVQWVAIKPDGSEADHVRMEDLSITWTRPQLWKGDDLVKAATVTTRGVAPGPTPASQLPAPVRHSLKQFAPTAAGLAAPAGVARVSLVANTPGARAVPDFHFVYIPPRA